MDLGIAGRRALVCAASKGLGKACAMALAREGVSVTILARNPGPLEETADEIRRASGSEVATVAADVATESGRAAALAACPDPDILVNNAGGPPPGDFRNWGREDWIAALDANMLTPILLMRAVVDGMVARRFGRIVNITSSAVKMPIPNLGLSNGARAGLTGFVGGLARQVAHANVTVNNLLPGPFATDRLKDNFKFQAQKAGTSFQEEWERRQRENPARRFGDPEEFGQLCAFVCGARSGYITGQNLLIDGGAYPGTL